MASSTRAWIVTDFGCLGGALIIAIFPPSVLVRSLSDILSYRILLSSSSARPKHELRFLAARGGSDPRSPKGSGRDSAARWGRSRLWSCFGRVRFPCLVSRICLLFLRLGSRLAEARGEISLEKSFPGTFHGHVDGPVRMPLK